MRGLNRAGKKPDHLKVQVPGPSSYTHFAGGTFREINIQAKALLRCGGEAWKH